MGFNAHILYVIVNSCGFRTVYADKVNNLLIGFSFDTNRYIKNMIIGSNKQKDTIIQQGITPRLIQLLDDPAGGDELKLEGMPVLTKV